MLNFCSDFWVFCIFLWNFGLCCRVRFMVRMLIIIRCVRCVEMGVQGLMLKDRLMGISIVVSLVSGVLDGFSMMMLVLFLWVSWIECSRVVLLLCCEIVIMQLLVLSSEVVMLWMCGLEQVIVGMFEWKNLCWVLLVMMLEVFWLQNLILLVCVSMFSVSWIVFGFR